MLGWSKLAWIWCVGWLSACAMETSDGAEEPQERLGERSERLSRAKLSKRQQATVLKLVDDICGDTWCEGDHNFSFDSLDCERACRAQGAQEGSCELTFRVFSYDTDLETGPTYTRSCRTEGFSGFDSLVESQGDYQSLAPAYYEALTQCISQVEDELPR
jgi:hypothetical protein